MNAHRNPKAKTSVGQTGWPPKRAIDSVRALRVTSANRSQIGRECMPRTATAGGKTPDRAAPIIQRARFGSQMP